jgi:hypothetical protein
MASPVTAKPVHTMIKKAPGGKRGTGCANAKMPRRNAAVAERSGQCFVNAGSASRTWATTVPQSPGAG